MVRKDTSTSVFIAALFTIGKTWKQPKCPSTEEWIKMCCVYTYIHTISLSIPFSSSQHTYTHTHTHTHTHTQRMAYYPAIKKNEIMPFAVTWMDLEILLSEGSQTEKDKYHMISLTWEILKK